VEPERLSAIGISALSVNLELFDVDLARKYMRRKHDQGRDSYLDFLERAAECMGPGRVRSMLLAGLEPMSSTLAGVEAIAARGCVPVLSPFRPDPSTPLHDLKAPTATALREVYLRAHEITQRFDVPLGPTCVPCSHNTLAFSAGGAGDADHHHGSPRVA
jgi:hypothetical protein